MYLVSILLNMADTAIFMPLPRGHARIGPFRRLWRLWLHWTINCSCRLERKEKVPLVKPWQSPTGTLGLIHDNHDKVGFASFLGVPLFKKWITTGWWFGTWILFFHMLGIIIPTDFHIFQRGWNHQPDKVGLFVNPFWMLTIWKWCQTFWAGSEKWWVKHG